MCLRGQQGAEGLQVPGNGTQVVGFSLLLALEDLRVCVWGGRWHSQLLAQTAVLRWAGLAHGVKCSVTENGARGPQRRGTAAVPDSGAVGGCSSLPLRDARSRACAWRPPKVTPGGREAIRDESGLSVLSDIKSVQNIK